MDRRVGLVTGLALLLATSLAGGAIVLARRSVRDLPGRMSDAEGHQLRFRIEGHGSPAVVLEIGLGGFLEEWATVQRGVADFARVVAYDRTGANLSTKPLAGSDIARQLHAALAAAGVAPPYLLVGQSFGGVYNRIFAARYPSEVVGLVLLDPAQETFIHWMAIHHPKEDVARLRRAHWPEASGINATLAELAASGPLPDVPVVVVTGAKVGKDSLRREVMPEWIASHEAWVRSLPRGRHVITDRSGHGIQVDEPELVVKLIREVLEPTSR